MRVPVTHILPLTNIIRERVMPVPGKVLVNPNQRISSTDIIAETNYAHEHVLLDIARSLGISYQEANRLIRCKIGDRLDQGEIVSEGEGLIPKRIRAPRSGRVVAIGAGQVLLEVGETGFKLQAGLPGLVTEIIPEYGAIIQTAGALIQGVWGNGHIETGLMMNLIEKPDDILDADRLDVSLRGSVILAGACVDRKILHTAAELPARGMIFSSLEPELISLAIQMSFPIIVLDGFGRLPMNSIAFKILSTNSKREVTVNAEQLDRFTGSRPEIIIPLPVSQESPMPRDFDTLAPGQQVRLRGVYYAGKLGTISNLRPGVSTMPSGLRVPAADVKLENGEQIIVPLVNLEIVG